MKVMKERQKKRNDRRRMLASVLAVLLALALVLSMVVPLLAADISGSEGGHITISGELGYNNRYKVNFATPVKVRLTNSGDDFKGDLQAKINVSGDKSFKRNHVYSYPVELPKGSSKLIELELPIYTVKSFQEIKLVDQGGNTVATKMLYCSAIDPETVLMGVFTDDKSSLNYLRQLKINMYASTPSNSVLGDKIVFFDETNFTPSQESLKSFNIIVINNYDTSRIKAKDLEALGEWVKSGGVLVIGTGANFDKVFKGLGSDIISATQTGTQTVSTSSLLEPEESESPESENSELGSEEPSNTEPQKENTQTEEIFLSNIKIDGDKTETGSGDAIFTSVLTSGLGNIVVHNFDLGTEPAVSSKIIWDHLSNEYPGLVNDKIYINYPGYSYNSLYYLLESLPSFDSGSVMLMFVIISVYIMTIGPVLYFILKKKDMREKGIVIIPALALITLALTYLMGVNAVYKKPIVNSITKLKMAQGEAFASAEANYAVLAPQNGDLKIAFDSDIIPKLNTQDYYGGYYYGGYNMNRVYEEDLAEIRHADTTELKFFKKASWDSNRFNTDKIVNLKGGIDASFDLKDGKLIGQITNNTGHDLEDVIVGIGYEFERYESLKNAETLKIEQKMDLSMQNQDYYSKIYEFYNDALMPQSGLNMEEKRKIYYKQTILIDSMQTALDMSMKYPGGYGRPMAASSSSTAIYVGAPSVGSTWSQDKDIIVSVYGFNYDKLTNSGELTVNGMVPTEFNTNLFLAETKYDYTKAESFELPFGIIGVSRISSDVSFDTGSANEIYLSDNGSLEISFNISAEAKIDLFKIKWDKAAGKEIYNVKTELWEELSEGEYDKSPRDYIDENGDLRIRGGVFERGSVILPAISVKGGQ